MNHHYKSKEIADDMWQIIDTNNGVAMYLIEGKEKALLIDAWDTREGLKEYINTLTNRPVDLLITHGHGDHAGCLHEFELVYH